MTVALQYDAHAAAAAWRAAGCTVIPVRPDRSKAPAAERWRDLYPAEHVVDTTSLFTAALQQHGPDVGVAVLTGSSSGRLELLEVEGPPEQAAALVQQLGEFAGRAGLGALWQRIAGGYVEASPKGGVHFLYRLADAPVPGNTKLARRPAGEHELNDAERRHLQNRPGHVFGRTTIETRGQGGYVIVAPTPAACSGADGPLQPWRFLAGNPGTIPTITAAERVELHALARACDTMPLREETPAAATSSRLPAQHGDDARPGDRFAAETPWQNILGPAGWRRLWEHGGKTYWCRPGKTVGVSATTTDEGPGDPGGLWVFSTSTTFEPETLYTKFGAWAHLEHGGDMSAAARALAGIGDPATNVLPLRPMPALAGAPVASPQPSAPATGPAPSSATAANPPGSTPPGPGVGGTGDPASISAPPARGPSWAPVDPTVFLSGTYTPPAGELLPRTDGVALLYRGKTHAMIGESESGKSLIVQAECARILRDTAELVLYVDYEDTPESVFGRMLLFGVDRQALATRFHYVRPESNPYVALETESFQRLLATPYAIAVIDGVTDALLQEPGSRGNGDPNVVATAWARRVLDPLAQWTGAAVVMIDHQPKNAESRGRFAIGAQAKMSVITGAAYIVEPYGRTPIGRGLCGELSVRVAKDRPGGVRPHAGPRRPGDRTQEAARIIVDSTSPTGRIVVSVGPQQTGDVHAGGEQHDDRGTRTSELMDTISRYVAVMGAASAAQVRREIKGRAETVVDAIRSLVAGGFLAEQAHRGRGGGMRYTVIRPYVHAVEHGRAAGEESGEPVRNGTEQVREQDHVNYGADGHRMPEPVPDHVPAANPFPSSQNANSFQPVPEPVPTREQDQQSTLTEPVPVLVPPAPIRGPGTGTGSGNDVGSAEQLAAAAAWSPSTVLETPAAPVAFLAPAAADPAPPWSPGRLTRRRPGDVVCPCGEVVDPMLVAQGATRHLLCEDL